MVEKKRKTYPYDLYGGKPPYVARDTSKEASEQIEPHVTRLARIVYAFVKKNGGATCFEVERDLKMMHQTASARLRELNLGKHIRDSGKRRRTGTGRFAIVWEIVKS